jgi:hypothetical protein
LKAGDKVRTGSAASAGEDKLIRNSIDAQRTKTVTIYIFYNPNNLKGQDDPGKFVLEAIKKADPEALKQVEVALKQLQLTLDKKAFEAYSFPELLGAKPLVVNPK